MVTGFWKKVATACVFATWISLWWLLLCIFHVAKWNDDDFELEFGSLLVCCTICVGVALLVSVFGTIDGVGLSRDAADICIIGSFYAFLTAGLGVLVALPYAGAPWWASIAGTCVAIIGLAGTVWALQGDKKLIAPVSGAAEKHTSNAEGRHESLASR